MKAISIAAASISVTLMIVTSVKAQTVHAVLAGDSEDSNIGSGVIINLAKVRSFLQRVEAEGEVKVSISEVRDGKFNCTEILKTLRAVRTGPDDVVFFYYAGHGFRRTATQTMFPEFDCRRTPELDRVDLSGIANELLRTPAEDGKSPPRLVLALADTCNIVVEGDEPRAAGRRPSGYAARDRKAAFRRLFLEYGGSLIMSGSQPGKPSWYKADGGFYTTQLLGAIDRGLASLEKARWPEIAVDASRPMTIPRREAQTPQFDASRLRGPIARQVASSAVEIRRNVR